MFSLNGIKGAEPIFSDQPQLHILINIGTGETQLRKIEFVFFALF